MIEKIGLTKNAVKRNIEITKVFTFDCAHSLVDYDGPCRNIHGHTYKLEVSVKGNVGHDGLVMDFHILRDIVENDIISRVDHIYLNDLFSFNPSCENIGLWMWEELDAKLKAHSVELSKIVLWETPTSFCTITREDVAAQ